jgi:hypothetical protein
MLFTRGQVNNKFSKAEVPIQVSTNLLQQEPQLNYLQTIPTTTPSSSILENSSVVGIKPYFRENFLFTTKTMPCLSKCTRTSCGWSCFQLFPWNTVLLGNESAKEQ